MWRVYLDYETEYANMSDGYMVASVEGGENAELIALAPDMADAILAWWENSCDDSHGPTFDALETLAEKLLQIGHAKALSNCNESNDTDTQP